MANPQSSLDALRNNPRAAGLLQNRELMDQLLHSPDTRRLMELLNQSAGEGLKAAADAAARGDPGRLAGLLRQVMQSREGAQVAERLQRSVPEP